MDINFLPTKRGRDAVVEVFDLDILGKEEVEDGGSPEGLVVGLGVGIVEVLKVADKELEHVAVESPITADDPVSRRSRLIS